MDSYDVVIAGGGVIGCALAWRLVTRRPGLRVLVLDKEKEIAFHQSGRNSGVVHAGYNQKPGTLKARLVVEGSRRLREFCREHHVPLYEGGILVVANEPSQEPTLSVLLERGTANGAQVELVNAAGIREREPHAAGLAALWAPEGASFDSRAYVQALAAQVRGAGGTLVTGVRVLALAEEDRSVRVLTNGNPVAARVFVNAAGLHADRIAWMLNVRRDLQIVPFRGYYSDVRPDRRWLVRSHIYACPDLEFPFLGVHLSRNVDGRVRVGPGAVLALGREAYGAVSASVPDLLEMLRFPGFWRMACQPAFRRLFKQEWRKSLFTTAVADEARGLVPDLRREDLLPSRAGIRAQLVSSDGKMVDDLAIEETPRSVQVLNAVSPALTCSLPFADLVAERVENKL